MGKLPPPSWSLETSGDNYQWGYILAVPERDAGRVNALLDGLVAAGLCADFRDPGMKGVTRYVRLPIGRNTKAKYGPTGFTCRLTGWHPERRFTMDELVGAWGIVLPVPGASPSARARRAPAGVAAENDPLFGHLDRWGMFSGARAADGVGYEMTCPWIGEHSDRADTGTAYWPGGGFRCHHGHGGEKGRGELIAWVNERLTDERGFGLAAGEFKDADRPAIDAFWNILVAGHVPGRGDVNRLSRVPGHGDVETMLRAAGAILGINPAPLLRRLTSARARRRREAQRRCQAAEREADQAALGTVVAAPTEWTAPVPLAEAQAQTARGLSDALAAARAAGVAPAGTAALGNGRRRQW